MNNLLQLWTVSRAECTSRGRSERALKSSSVAVYQEMWSAFTAYCAAQALRLEDLAAADIEAFLGTRKRKHAKQDWALSIRYQRRMVFLIDRLLRFHADRSGQPPNLAAHALLQLPPYRQANAVDLDDAPKHLSSAEVRQLIAYLADVDRGAVHEKLSWKRLRDHAAVALMLDAGLTPLEVRRLRHADLVLHTQTQRGHAVALRVPYPNDLGHVRRPPISYWTSQLLKAWLAHRATPHVKGDLVFPSTRTGKAWSHTGFQQACKEVLRKAGLADTAGGLFRLRHTFAVHHLSAGVSEPTVAAWLGYLDVNTIQQYRTLLPSQSG